MIPVRLYINKRKESLRQLENQPNYTRLTLLEIASTILDEADSREVDDFVNDKHVPMAMKEYAQESVQKKYTLNMKLTSKNAEDHLVPLPITIRKRQLLHHYASNGLRLPQEMLVKKTRGTGRGGQRGGNRFGGGRNGNNKHNGNQNGNKNGNRDDQQKTGRGGRGGKHGRGGNRGGRAPPGNKENQTPENQTQTQTNERKCESVFETYDLSNLGC